MGFPVICRLINVLLFDWLIRKGTGVSKRVCLVPSSETQGSQFGREKSQARAEEPQGTDSHRTISKRSSEYWLLIGHKEYDCAQSANSVDCYCLDQGLSGSCTVEMHAVRKLSVFDINSPFQSTVYPKTKTWKRIKDAFPKIQALAYNKHSSLHRSHPRKY